MNKAEILTQINRVKYWNSRIEVAKGIYTPGRKKLNSYDQYKIPPNAIKNKRVLEIGAWDGYESFICEKLGADYILATDVWSDVPSNIEYWDNIRNSDEGFRTIARILNSNVAQKNISVYDLSPESVGTFDVVFFIGILYHLKHPLYALEKVASVCEGLLVFESAVLVPSFPEENWMNDIPILQFRGEAGWWPNKRSITDMLSLVGFNRFDFSMNPRILTEMDPVDAFLKNDVEARQRLDNEHPVMRFNKNTAVQILNTEFGNMDLDNSEADWLKIQCRNSYQGWIRKEDVDYKSKEHSIFKKKPVSEKTTISRLFLKAYK